MAARLDHAWVVERSKATGCKPVGLISYVGSNPTPCTRLGKAEGERIRDKVTEVAGSFLLYLFSY